MTSSLPLSPVVRRVWLGLLAASAVFGALLLTLSLVPVDSTQNEKDFVQEYLLARAILDRVDPYQPIQVLAARYGDVTGFFQKAHPTPHPPTVGLLALPLGLMSYPSAVRAWFAIELLCLVAAVALLIRGADMPIRLRYAPLLAVGLVAWPPLTLELGLGQLMLPLLLMLAGAQVALVAGRSALGGGLLGLTLAIKPIAWPWLIVLAWRRDWRAVASALVVILAGGVLSVVAIGVGPVFNYLTLVLPTTGSTYLNTSTNMSLWTVAPRLGMVSLSSVLPVAMLLAAVWWTCRRLSLAVSLSIMTIASLLASPILWYFYLALALLPLAHVLAALRRGGTRWMEGAAVLGVFALMSVPDSQLDNLSRSEAGAGVLLEPALALGLLGVLLAWQTRPVAPRGTPRSTCLHT